MTQRDGRESGENERRRMAVPTLETANKLLESVRLPQNKAEEAELRALSAQGPYEVYKWIYGPDNFFTQSVSGQRWENLRVSDPALGAREIVDFLKQLKGNSPLAWVEWVQIYFMSFAALLFIGELLMTDYIPNHGLDLWRAVLSLTAGACLAVFVMSRAMSSLLCRLFE